MKMAYRIIVQNGQITLLIKIRQKNWDGWENYFNICPDCSYALAHAHT